MPTWKSQFAIEGTLDSESSMPTLESTDTMDGTQLEALRDAAIALETRVGLRPGGDPSWGYLGTTLPSGVSAPAEAVYQFNGTTDPTWFPAPTYGEKWLTNSAMQQDLSGNAHHLSYHTYRWGPVVSDYYYGFRGMYLGSFSELRETTADAGLRITGELTLEMVVNFGHMPDADIEIIRYASWQDVNNNRSWSTEADNTLYSLWMHWSTNRMAYYSQTGSVTDQACWFDTFIPCGPVYYLTLTRNADGGVKFYMDGDQVGENLILESPTGGSNGHLYLAGNYFQGTIFSVRITPAEFTADQVSTVYNTLRGL